jgi:CHAT domain-containing protein
MPTAPEGLLGWLSNPDSKSAFRALARLHFGAIITNSMSSNISTAKLFVIHITAFTTIGVLPAPSNRAAFGQESKGTNPSPSVPIAKTAEQLFQEAVTLSSAGEPKSGLEQLTAAMRLWIQMHEPQKAARAAIQVGESFQRAKRYQESLSCYRKASNVKSLPPSEKAMAFNSIASVYAELYLREFAELYYEKALKQARIASDSSMQAAAWTGLANLHHQRGEKNEALACIAHARQLDGQLADEGAQAVLLHLAGQIDQEQGLLEQARKDFEGALSLYRRIGDEEGEVRVLCSISSLDLFSDQKEAALVRAEHAVELAEKQGKRAVSNGAKLRARESLWRAWLSQARAQRAVGQKERAIRSFKWVIHQGEGLFLLVYIATDASSVSFREELQAPYRELVDLLIEKGQLEEAYQWVEHAKARAMLGLTEARRINGPPRKVDMDGDLGELVRSIAGLRTQLLSSDISQEQRAKIQRELREKEYALEEAQLTVEMQQSRDRNAGVQHADVNQIQEMADLDKSTILEFFLGENRSFVWLISSNDFFVETLPGRKDIEDAVRQYLRVVSVAPNNLYIERDLSKAKERAENLFSLLFGASRERIEQNQKLIVVPDGVLHYLPFEALIHNGRYLVEKHEISYVPSGSMLRLWQDSRNKPEAGDKMELLAFGDPVFGPEQKASIAKNSKRRVGNIVRQGRASRGYQLASLPRTRDEVQDIAGLFPPERTRLYLGRDSTEAAVKRESLRQYRRLHFATHSLIDEVSPSRSAVVLSMDPNDTEDGFLEASEISELDLDCDLVVLSACQTARGQLLSGEGIVGLSRAFLYAGARAVVVSLWNVSDISTGALMKSFYRHLVAGNGNAAALRQTKIEMLKGGSETRHPYYWAAFITIGKP